MTEKALEVDNVSGGYGDLKVVKEISLDVYEGSANGVTGRNGVGKTTFLKLICGALPLFGGHVRLYGRIINRLTRINKSCPQETLLAKKIEKNI